MGTIVAMFKLAEIFILPGVIMIGNAKNRICFVRYQKIMLSIICVTLIVKSYARGRRLRFKGISTIL